MGNVAATEVSDVIWIWLVGLASKTRSVLHRNNEWLKFAINADEKFGVSQDRYRAILYQSMALGQWMETGDDDARLWGFARGHREAGWLEKDILKDSLDDYMAFAVQEGSCNEGAESGISMYEKQVGVKDISLKNLLKPRDFGYAACLNLVSRRFDKDEMLAAGKRMLQANLEEKWLGSGQYVRAAMWLKIVYWHQNENFTPLETLLKAYENMPNVPRPDFL
ncbi:hypothetical protein [Variovorax sp. GB4R4]